MSKFGTAIILAGGKSRRMGFDKQLLMINEKRLIIKIVEKLKQEFSEIIVVTNNPIFYKDLKLCIVSDEIKNKGPLGGIHVGLKNATSEYSYLIACDMPIINSKYINFLKQELKDILKDAVVAKQGEFIEPFNAFYNKSLVGKIEEYLAVDAPSIQGFLNNMDCRYIDENKAREYSKNWNMFLNLNTKDDVLKYRNIGE